MASAACVAPTAPTANRDRPLIGMVVENVVTGAAGSYSGEMERPGTASAEERDVALAIKIKLLQAATGSSSQYLDLDDAEDDEDEDEMHDMAFDEVIIIEAEADLEEMVYDDNDDDDNDDDPPMLREEEDQTLLNAADQLSDWDFLQYGMSSIPASPSDWFRNEQLAIQESLSRIYGMQCFKETYDIDDTVEQGVELVGQWIRCPNTPIVRVSIQTGKPPLVVLDWTLLRELQHDESLWRLVLGGMYYVLQSLLPDVPCMRQVITFQCQSKDGALMDDMLQQVLEELYRVFPVRAKFVPASCTTLNSLQGQELIRFVNDNLRKRLQEVHTFSF